MTFCATALTLHDERIFRQAPLPHLPNLFFIFYFQKTTKWNLSWPTFFIFSQNGALNVLTDIPLFPCVCVPAGEVRVVPLFLTNRYRIILPHSKISIMPLSVRLVSCFKCRWNKRGPRLLWDDEFQLDLRSLFIWHLFFLNFLHARLSTFCLKAQFITNIIDVFLETYLSFVGMAPILFHFFSM